MALLFHVSNSFSKRFKSEVSQLPGSVSHDGRPNAWSLHVVKLGRSPFVMAMNDATLWPVLIPVTGITTLKEFLPTILRKIEKAWARFGREFDSENVSIVQFPRSNRSLIGSMNDAIRMLNYEVEDAGTANRSPDWEAAVASLERMPYSALPGNFPDKAMLRIVSLPDVPMGCE